MCIILLSRFVTTNLRPEKALSHENVISNKSFISEQMTTTYMRTSPLIVYDN